MRIFQKNKKENNGGLARMTKSGGFTVIELLIVTSIMVILSSVVIMNHRYADAQLRVERSANKLAQDIRRASAMALSSQEQEDLNDCTGGNSVSGFGVNLKPPLNNSYKLYGDCGVGGRGNQKFNSSDWLIEEISLEQGIIIKSLSPDGNISINFTPPSPSVDFKKGNDDDDEGDGDVLTDNEVIITLQSERYLGLIKIVTVNEAGVVTVP